jgi:predicted dehydrogenase
MDSLKGLLDCNKIPMSIYRPRIGFLGCGWIGRARLEALLRAGVCSLVAIADLDQESRRFARTIAPEAEIFDSFLPLLACNLDGIVISTPNAQHAEQSQIALRHGLAVFCQKPLGLNTQETAQVITAARQADRLIASDFPYRFTSSMQRIDRMISTGTLGKLYALELLFHNSYGPDKAWYYDPALSGGGCLIDLGIHLVDLALWILRFPAVRVSSARLFSRGVINTNKIGPPEDYATAVLDSDYNTRISITCSWKQPMRGQAMIYGAFRGSNGLAEFRNVDGSFYDFSAEYHSATQHEVLSEPPDEWAGRALIAWVSQLGRENRFNESSSELLRVANLVDDLYAASRSESLA